MPSDEGLLSLQAHGPLPRFRRRDQDLSLFLDPVNLFYCTRTCRRHPPSFNSIYLLSNISVHKRQPSLSSFSIELAEKLGKKQCVPINLVSSQAGYLRLIAVYGYRVPHAFWETSLTSASARLGRQFL